MPENDTTPPTPPAPKPRTRHSKLTISKETPNQPQLVALELKDREKLRAILNDPVFVKAWSNAMAYRPSVMANNLDTELGPQIALRRLCQLQGWEMFSVALRRQVEDPRIKRGPLQETYPDSGLPGAQS